MGRKLFLAILLLVMYQAAVWGFVRKAVPPAVSLPLCIILTVAGNTLFALYAWVVYGSAQPRVPAPAWDPAAIPGAAWQEPAWQDPSAPDQLVAQSAQQLGGVPIGSLPIYFVCGPENGGKTSLIYSAEINVTPLGAQTEPSHNIWRAGESLLVEQGSAAAWADPLASRRMLEAFGRPPRLQGVILCCPIDPFLGMQDMGRLNALANQVQGHLTEIGAAAGTFPVYVIFTKSDSIPYFPEFFGGLMDPERRQILGCTLPEGNVPDTAAITSAYNGLYAGLAEKRILYLQREQSPARKGAIYEFPREIRRIRGAVVQFLGKIRPVAPTYSGAVLRGFYFTGWAPPVEGAANGVRFFAADLFRQLLPAPGVPTAVPVHFAAASAGSSWRFVPALVVSLLLMGLFGLSWYQNHTLLTATRTAAEACRPLPPGTAPSAVELGRIDALRRQVQTLVRYQEEHPPLTMRLGLYSGDEVAGPAQKLYFRRFQQYFLDAIVRSLESEFSALPSRESASYPYATVRAHLAVYRAITGSAGKRDPVDPSLAEWLLLIWRDSPAWNARGDRIAMAGFELYAHVLKRHPAGKEMQFTSGAAAMVQRATDYLHYFKGRPDGL